jgi:hypothetical protein
MKNGWRELSVERRCNGVNQEISLHVLAPTTERAKGDDIDRQTTIFYAVQRYHE